MFGIKNLSIQINYKVFTRFDFFKILKYILDSGPVSVFLSVCGLFLVDSLSTTDGRSLVTHGYVFSKMTTF